MYWVPTMTSLWRTSHFNGLDRATATAFPTKMKAAFHQFTRGWDQSLIDQHWPWQTTLLKTTICIMNLSTSSHLGILIKFLPIEMDQPYRQILPLWRISSIPNRKYSMKSTTPNFFRLSWRLWLNGTFRRYNAEKIQGNLLHFLFQMFNLGV